MYSARNFEFIVFYYNDDDDDDDDDNNNIFSTCYGLDSQGIESMRG